MFKYLSLLLSTGLITTIVGNSPVTQQIAKGINSLMDWEGHQFYQDLSQNFTTPITVSDFDGGIGDPPQNDIVLDQGIIFNWSEYADSWWNFVNNYQSLQISADIVIKFMNHGSGVDASWDISSFDIPLSMIADNSVDAQYQTIKTVNHETTYEFRSDNCSATLSYFAWQDSSGSVYLKFATHTNSTINWNSFHFDINTKSVSAKTVCDYKKDIYQKIIDTINTKGTIDVTSDFSRSLEDPRNWDLLNSKIKSLAQASLGDKYQEWASTLFPEKTEDGSATGIYAYSDATNLITWTIKFTALTDQKETTWTINIPAEVNLDKQYDANQLGKYLTVNPSKVVNVNNPNGPMVVDTAEEGQVDPTKNNVTLTYHAAIELNFAAANSGFEKGNEYMTVNDKSIDVSTNSVSTDKLEDNRLQPSDNKDKNDATNKYVVKLFIKNPQGDIDQFTRTYIINQVAPQLNISWYAWDPSEANKDFLNDQKQKGSKIDSATGTIFETIWVHNNPPLGEVYPYDPLDHNGDIIKSPNQYDKGYIAQAITCLKAIQVIIPKDPNVKITKIQLDPNTLQTTGQAQAVTNDSIYQPDNGIWLFSISEKGFTSYKIVRTGQRTINSFNGVYQDFLNTLLQGKTLASPIWETMEGSHLKFYLNSVDALTGPQINKLDFENIDLYWKEYVSDAKSQMVPPQPGNLADLSKVGINNIKIEAKSIDDLKNQILSGFKNSIGVAAQISNWIPGIVYNTDYTIDFNDISKLLDFDKSGKSEMTIKISASLTSLKVYGSTTVTVINYQENLEHAIDLSKIKFDDQNYNFSKDSPQLIKNWILKEVNFKLLQYPYTENNKDSVALEYGADYSIKPLDDTTLKNFIGSLNGKLVLTVYASDSIRAVNSTTITLINNPKAPSPPPPNPGPSPDGPSYITSSTTKTLIWLIPIITVILITMISLIFWFKYRSNKKVK